MFVFRREKDGVWTDFDKCKCTANHDGKNSILKKNKENSIFF